ncbi:helix-turn-helix transcriptional regulator [Mesorhizobium humile]|uniref:Helix-turn-helix transcriptional regulator n=1 Tax=Mesorhizobium humile TaxID=3072313 RepID=A0ABU4YFT5_9HYPH|nr:MULTISPECIES: helix-turn-helix transcriptional regulator [unclassified Mesorhizobium]MDX8457590.1 helix-turn-helix transcriptional regulator [Mesorhizobium sp. VK2D]MDX8485601.1 helix-turn-helix transcriptional regulator [Mesorhizobium sp. VK2B]
MNQVVPDEVALQRQVNRRQLQMIIAGLGEGIILVDPKEGIVWANESALALHNISELPQLGTSAADYRDSFELKYRNHHPLDEGQYPVDRLLAGDEFRDVTVELARKRSNTIEDRRRVLKFHGFALPDAKGNPESYVLVIENVTEKISAEERFERAFAANPAPALICRLSDLRYVRVNSGFLQMTGCSRDDVIGRSTYEFDVLENAGAKEAAIASLREGRTIPQMESMLRLPDGGKAVIVAGQPIEIGDEKCMLFSFIDMEPRRQAEDALRQSEERFARSFRLTPIPTMLSTRQQLRVLDVNDAFEAVLGYEPEEVIGRTSPELPIWVDAASGKRLDREIEAAGSLRKLELQLRTKHDEVLDCLVSTETISIQGEECVLTVIQDITERKRSEVELIAAIEAVMQDTSWVSRTIIEKLAHLRRPGASGKPEAGLADLTPRELEILGLMSQGLSNVEIVKKLGVTQNTVRNHIARIYVKADVHNRAGAVVWARERGFTGIGAGSSKRPRRH